MTAAIPWDPSAWLRQRVAERIHDAQRGGLDPFNGPGFVMALGSIVDPERLMDDRPCDRCGTTVPENEPWVPVLIAVTEHMQLAGGLCGDCREREGDMR